MSLQWPGAGTGRTAITLMSAGGMFSAAAPIGTLEPRPGAWALSRLLDQGSVLRQGDGLVATFVVGGREVSYSLAVNSVLNPLTLPALREFHCPAGL